MATSNPLFSGAIGVYNGVVIHDSGGGMGATRNEPAMKAMTPEEHALFVLANAADDCCECRRSPWNGPLRWVYCRCPCHLQEISAWYEVKVP